MTEDIVAFVKARLDEDERIANAAADAFLHGDRIGIERDKLHPSVCMHVYSWTTARVLREVEAKRTMLAVAAVMVMDLPLPAGTPAKAARLEAIAHDTERRQGSTFLQLLALPYADHPDYRKEWRP